MSEHTTDKCSQYDEEIIDEVCQDPRIHSLVCVNCRFNKGLSIKPKTKTAELALGPVEIPIEEPPREEEKHKAIEEMERREIEEHQSED